MKHGYIIKSCLALCLGVLPSFSWAKVLVAKKDEVKILEKADKNANAIGSLKKDQTLEAGERKGMYWEVTMSNGAKGFVSIMGVEIKAVDDNPTLSNALRSVVQNKRSEDDPSTTRERSAVMGVRGLDDSKETQFAGSVKPNLRMVYKMESVKVGKRQIDRLDNDVKKELEEK